jgi:predicted DNA-binding WGR domain protein
MSSTRTFRSTPAGENRSSDRRRLREAEAQSRNTSRFERFNGGFTSGDRFDYFCDTLAGGKVWSVERISRTEAVVSWGRVGGSKRSKTHTARYPNVLSATLNKLVASKLDKGYVRG